MTVAIVGTHYGTNSAAFTYCLTRTMIYETARTARPPVLIWQRHASGQLVEARNETAAYVLSTDAEWALFVDADMGFPADLIERLLESADPVERPIVGALCFGLKKQGADDPDTQAVTLRCFPTIYQYRELEDKVGFQVVTDYPRDTLVECSASGAACFLVHRSVLDKIEKTFGPEWFSKVTHPKGPTTFSEDLSFFVRVAACDFPVYVDTSVKTSHDKGGVFLTEAHWDTQQKAVTNGCN